MTAKDNDVPQVKITKLAFIKEIASVLWLASLVVSVIAFVAVSFILFLNGESWSKSFAYAGIAAGIQFTLYFLSSFFYYFYFIRIEIKTFPAVGLFFLYVSTAIIIMKYLIRHHYSDRFLTIMVFILMGLLVNIMRPFYYFIDIFRNSYKRVQYQHDADKKYWTDQYNRITRNKL